MYFARDYRRVNKIVSRDLVRMEMRQGSDRFLSRFHLLTFFPILLFDSSLSFFPFFDRSRGNRFGTLSNPPHRISINPLYSSWTRSSPSISLRFSSVRAYFQFSRYIRPLAIEDKTFSSLSVGLPVCLACSLPVL